MNPDQLYRIKAASDPVSPATAWLYPSLRLVEDGRQRALLEEATRSARAHWISRALRILGLVVVALNAWALATDRAQLHRAFTYSLPLFILAWLLHDFFRTRMKLQSDASQVSSNTSLERTREG
jgi:hypothetical protein